MAAPLYIACILGHSDAISLLLADPRTDASKVNIDSPNISAEVRTVFKAAIFKAKIMQALKSNKDNDNLKNEFANLPEDVKPELVKQLQQDIKELAAKAHTSNIKKIISVFPEDQRMAYFRDVVKDTIRCCYQQKIIAVDIQKMQQ